MFNKFPINIEILISPNLQTICAFRPKQANFIFLLATADGYFLLFLSLLQYLNRYAECIILTPNLQISKSSH